MEKKVPQVKFLKFCFGLKNPKWPFHRGRGEGEVAKALVLKSKCPFTSQKCPFIPELPFVLQKCPFAYWNRPLVFQRCLLFIYCARLFPRMLFSWLYLLLVLLRAAQGDNICFPVLLSLKTIYLPPYDALHLACVHIQAITKF